MGLFKMAWRNIWRNARRTAVTIGAMALALLAMVLVTSMTEGFLGNMERRIVEIELGDLQIYARDYQKKPSIYNLIDQPGELVQRLNDAGFRAAPRLLGGALVAAGNESAGVSLRGIEIEKDQQVSEIYQQIDSGHWLSVDDATGVVLGKRLAKTLGVQVGDELVVLSQATDGSMANDLFFVRGVLVTTGDATDRAGVFLPADTFRDFFILPVGAHQLLVRRPDQLDLELSTRQAARLAPQLDVRNWKQLMPTLASISESARAAMIGVMFVMYLVIAIVILNATLMAVFERVREFGVLKALGVEPGTVIRLILVETAMQTALACTIALSLSLPALYYLSTTGLNMGKLGGVSMAGMTFDPYIRAVVTTNSFILPVVLLVTIVFSGAVYPAVKAARILPVEAMRHQ